MAYSPVLTCPKLKCTGSYTASTLPQHFLSQHSELVFKNKFEIKRTLRDLPIKNFNEDKAVYMLFDEREPYFLMVYGSCKVDINDPRYIGSYQYYFGIFYLSNNERTKTMYDLKIIITDENGVNTDYSWHDRPVKMLKDEDYLKKPDMFLWNTINIENKGCQYVIRHSVQLIDNKCHDINVPSQSVACYKEVARPSEIPTIASKLECPICFEYLFTPIYLCASGHSLCSKCKLKVKKCALCEAVVGNSRNYTLEQILETLEICCPNVAKGCTNAATVNIIKMHMLSCVFNE